MLEELKYAKRLWDFHSVSHTVVRSDLIVGLGSYDLRVAERSAELFLDDLAPELVFSGAQGNWTASLFSETEAEDFAKHAVALGVPADRIVLEQKGIRPVVPL